MINQESMDRRIEELYIEQFEKDITKKVEKQGYIVKKCKVEAKISQDENNTGITKIKLKIEKNNNANDDILNENNNLKDFEDKIVTEIQKIKKVNTEVSKVIADTEDDSNDSITKQDIQNLKLFLIKEYEVNEKCLEIN